MVMVGLRGFESDIIESFKFFGGGKAKPRLGVWIRGHLQDEGEDYPYSMWQQWIEFCNLAKGEGANIPKNNYTQFVIYIYCLEKASLVRVVREEPYRLEGIPNKEINIRYYSIIKPQLRNILWQNPRRGSPNFIKWKELLEEKRKEYQSRRYTRKRGRPPTLSIQRERE